MTAILMSLLALCGALAPADTQLITSPPKLESESSRLVVWYQIHNSGSAHKFELKCQASGDPEKYVWTKNGMPYEIDGKRVVWQRQGQSGTIVFLQPQVADQGFYQCRAVNIFGIAVSNIYEVKLGTLEHFPNKPIREIVIEQGQPLTLPCKSPYGVPKPTIFWLFRNTKQSFVIETIDRPHITVDGEGNLQFSYVEMHDGRENLLYQCAATSPVLHGEYRAGDEIRLVVKEAPLVATPPKPMWFSPNDMLVTAGETLKLMCIFSGYPIPTVVWVKKNGELPVERLNHENFGRTLVIKPVLPVDEGTYICKVNDIEHKMVVRVTSAPQWIDGPPDDFDLPEEADVELKCRATGDPSPVVRWYKNGDPIDDENKRRTTIDNGEILRIVSLDHRVDRAVYQCNASNPLGYVFANAYINVRAHAPRFETAISQTLKVTIGSNVDLDCSVNAAPKPDVNWFDGKRKKMKPDGKYEIFPNHTLRIYNVRMQDASIYLCDVNNKFGINEAKRVLEIYKPTQFVFQLSPKEKTLEAGDEFEMTCAAESDERLSISYTWTKNNYPIDFASEQSIKRTSESNRIRFTNVRGKNSGTYKCIALTDVDQVASEMRLVVKDVPDAPVITSISCRETQALINWTAAFHNYDPVVEYFVEYNTEYHPNDWKVGMVVQSVEHKQAYEAGVPLSPWVVYNFKIVAANSYGRGNAGYMPSVKCSTPPSYPYDNPMNVTASGNRKDNLIVYWKPMEKELWNAEKLHYVVYYRKADPQLQPDSGEWQERRIEDPDLGYTEFRDLPSYKPFQVKVKAFNIMGGSLEEPTTVLGYSGEDFPSAEPKNIEVTEIGASTVRLKWTPIDPITVNGPLLGYKIHAWELHHDNKPAAHPDVEVTVSRFHSSALVSGLQPLRTYAANVFVYNSKHSSPPSKIVTFSTKEGPPSIVENLVVEAYGAQTILSTWNAPKSFEGESKIYRVEYFENSSDKKVYDVVVTDTKHVMESLKPQTNYSVYVWAETSGGVGSKLNKTVLTYSKDEKPSKPKFSARTLNLSSIEVTFLPSRTGLPGTAFHVNYSRADSNHWLRTPTTYVEKSFANIVTDLLPDVDYKFVLHAEHGAHSTPSDPVLFRTVNRTVLEQTRQVEDSLTGAAWFIAVICAIAVALLTIVVICVCRRNSGGKYPVKKKELERGHHLEKDEERSFMEYQYGSGSSNLTNP